MRYAYANMGPGRLPDKALLVDFTQFQYASQDQVKDHVPAW